jgi:beta-glucanase (GH16 family)
MSSTDVWLQRGALILGAVFLVSACSDGDREQPLRQIETIPAADTETRTNVNISNPSLTTVDNEEVSPGEALTLVWSDEFNGTKLDPAVWFFETGDGSQYGPDLIGWGNDELQWYLPDNAELSDGKLKITARRETANGYNYTSARINTRDRFAFRYGRIEASIKLPPGQGIWPAFWLLAQDSPYGRWAASGEIDIVEAVNLDGTGGNRIYGTIHYGGEFPANLSTGARYTPSTDVTGEFNTYAVEWDATEIRWYVNDTLYAVQNSWSSTAAPFPAPFDQNFYIIFNVAVGGRFPGPPSGATQLPVTMEVDWVRVYSGEPDGGGGGTGIIPEAVVYATDPAVVEDLAPPGFDNFGSGAVFDGAFAGDADYNPAFQVTSGTDYGAGVDVGFVAFTGYAAGFAAGYGTVEFKVKVNAPGAVDKFEVKFIGGTDTPRTYDLATYSGSTPLGNGWYQVQIPMSDFAANIAANSGFLLGPQGEQAGPFTMLLTDIGFSGTAGGGGGGGASCDPVGSEFAAANGDFELGNLDCWTTFDNGGTIGVVADNGPSAPGSSAGRVNVTVPGNPTLKLANLGAGTLAPGQQVTVSFDWKGVDANGGVVDVVLFSELSGGGVSKEDRILGGGGFPANWTKVGPLNLTAGADVSGGVTLQITAICGGVAGCVSDVFIDNVSIVIN